MNYPPYSNDPNDPHSQPTTAGSYPQWPQQPGQPPQYPQQPGQPSYPQWGQPDPTTAGQYPQWGQQVPPPPPQFPQQPGQYPQSGQSFPQYPQQYPQPGQFGVPPQQPAKPTFKQRFRAMSPWKRFGTIGCSTIIASILLCSLCAIVGNALPAPPKQPSTADTSQASPTAHQVDSIQTTPRPTETPTPTPSPTPIPTPTLAVSGPPILGADIRTFISKYGQPNDHSTVNTGSYHFQRYSDSNIDFLIIQTDPTDGSTYTKLVDWVTANASDAGSDAGWSQQQADTTCSQFFPPDAVYKNQVPLSDNSGYDKIYYSASLASVFPTSAFTDASQKQVQAGLFDIQYLTKSASDSNIVSCSIMIGTQQTQ